MHFHVRNFVRAATLCAAGTFLAGWAGSASADGFSSLNVGIDYLNQRRFDDAVTWLNKAIAAKDLNPDQMHLAYVDLGQAHAQLKQPQVAVEDFTAALAIRPDDLSAQVERSFAYLAAGQSQRAMDDMTAAPVGTSKIPRIIFDRGLMAWEMERYPDAAAAFSELADKGYYDGWFWLQLANIKQNKAVTKYSGVHLADGSIVISGIPYRWPGPAMSLYAGDKTESDVLNAMESDFASRNTECQGNFYLGAWRLVHGDAAGAKPLLQKAVDVCEKGNVEERMAVFELKKL
jgi:tetratricopeptide (TPR) repeat protein